MLPVKMRHVIFILSCFVFVTAQEHKRCESPAAWEAEFVGNYGAGGRYVRGYAAYDKVHERIHVVEKAEENSTTQTYEILLLYKQRATYTVNRKTRKCSKEALNETFKPIEILPNSTYIGDVVIGTLNGPGTGVLGSYWEHRSDEGVLIQLFTVTGCIPMEISSYKKNSMQEQLLDFYQYYNVRAGIKDPSVFDVPKECL